MKKKLLILGSLVGVFALGIGSTFGILALTQDEDVYVINPTANVDAESAVTSDYYDEDDDSEVVLNESELPAYVQEYLTANYPDETILYAEQEGDEIEVSMVSGLEIEFEADGSIEVEYEDEDEDEDEDQEDDDSDDVVVPATELPESALNYLSENFPNQTILKVEKDATYYEVYLTNGIEVYFDLSGQFIEQDLD